MTRRWIAPGLLLLVFAAAAAMCALERPGERPELPSPTEPSAVRVADHANSPQLVGRTEGSPPARAVAGDAAGEAAPAAGSPTRSLDGVVVDARGEGVPGALVYLPRPASEGEQEPLHVTTDAQGRWKLAAPTPSTPWIGVVARGFLPLQHPIGGAQGDRPIRLVLQAGPELVLRVQGTDGGPLELNTTLHVEPTAKTAQPWPGPGEIWKFEEEVTIAPGSQEAHIRLGTTSEVRVDARYWHLAWTVDPKDPVITPNGQTLTFTIAPSCVLDFRILDAATGQPLERGFAYKLLAGDKLVTGGMTSTAGGRLRMDLGVRPGRYVVRVWATGYQPRESTVALAAPGDEAPVEIRLEADPDRGSLRISVPTLAALPRRPLGRGEDYAAPAFFLWKRGRALADPWERDMAPEDAWGNLEGDSRRESDTDYLFEGVPNGEVTLLVGEAVSGRVALVKDLRIRGGRTDTVTIPLEAGIRFDPKEVVPSQGKCRSFRVRHPIHGELPTWSFRSGSSYVLDPGEVPLPEGLVGPYPGPAIEVETVLEDGTTETREFRVP